ncbi:MAG: hypothetical protein ACLRFE_00145 [Clostridia bacterium]
MSLIKFLLFRNKKTSVLAYRKYGKENKTEPQETSLLSSRQYGKCVSQNQHKQNQEQVLTK